MVAGAALAPCKEWKGARSGKGYGQRRIDRKLFYVHRLEWEAHHGPIPPGLQICHRCDNPACHEITHLFIGTARDNMLDKMRKGRGNQPTGENAARARLTSREVASLRARRAAGARVGDLARETGHDSGAMSRILRGLRHPPR